MRLMLLVGSELLTIGSKEIAVRDTHTTAAAYPAHHEFWMDHALSLARSALVVAPREEVPIGAVMVQYGDDAPPEGSLLATGMNLKENQGDPTAHAELNAIRRAAALLGRWRLTGCTLYVTVEPCLMCAAAAYHARLDCVVYGVASPKFGALGSLYDLTKDTRLNHQLRCLSGIRSAEAAALMQHFFQQRRC